MGSPVLVGIGTIALLLGLVLIMAPTRYLVELDNSITRRWLISSSIKGDEYSAARAFYRTLGAILVIAGLLSLLLGIGFLAAERRGTTSVSIDNISARQIQGATISPPSQSGYPSLVPGPVRISDANDLRELNVLLQRATATMANHPTVQWYVELDVVFADGKMTCRVMHTNGSANGTLITVKQGAGIWSRMYRCDDLGPFLQKLTSP